MEEQLPEYVSFWRRHLIIFLFSGLLVLSVFIRFFGLSEGKNFDTARTTIVETQKIQQVVAAVKFNKLDILRIEGSRNGLPIGMAHGHNDPFYESILPTYFLAPVYFLFNFDFAKIVYFYAFVGVLTILAVFWLSRLVFSTKIAIAACLFYLFNFWMLASSHFVLNLTFTPLLICLTFGFLIKIFRGDNKFRNWLGFVVFYGLAIQFQVITLLLLPLFPVLLFFYKRTASLGVGKSLLLLVTFFITIALPLVAEVKSGFEQSLAWLGYIPKMLGTNILDIYKDFFVAVGKNITVFIFPTIHTSDFVMWLFGAGFMAFLIYRMLVIKKRGGIRQSLEVVLILSLLWFSLISYVNYIAYFKGQLSDLTTVKSMGFFWPIFVIYSLSFVSFERRNIRFPLGVIAAFLLLMNVFVWGKNIDYTRILGINYDTRIRIVDAVSSTKVNTRNNVELDIIDNDPQVFAFLSLNKHLVPPALVNGTKLDTYYIVQKGDKLLVNYSMDKSIVSTMIRNIKDVMTTRNNAQNVLEQPGLNYFVTDKEYSDNGALVKSLGEIKIILKK